MPAIHQWVPSLVPGDAMGAAAVAWRGVLRGLGVWGDLYAHEVAPGLSALARPVTEFVDRPGDVVLYHHGIASPLAGRFMHLAARKVVVFHNISPASAYPGTRLGRALVHGRAQLAAMAGVAELGIGVSAYNVAELVEAGYRRTAHVPLPVEPARFAPDRADPSLWARLKALPRPRVVSVGRVVAHKRVEDLLSVHRELLAITPSAQLLVAGSAPPGSPAVATVRRLARDLPGVHLLGKVSFAELVAVYRSADVYLSMSEHEGFGVPLVEAMAAGIPVIAFAAAAVPETMAGAGVTFDEKNAAAVAELVSLVAADPTVRRPLVAGQQRRLEALSPRHTARALAEAFPRPRRQGLVRARPRVGVVVQRFGPHIIGGAEAHARMVAHRLAAHADVEVFTTCARDHLTWANEDAPGDELDGPLLVHRFPCRLRRHMAPFNRLSGELFGGAQDLVTEEAWLGAQGPDAPGLLEALPDADVDAFIFFTALYATTVHGLPLVRERAVLVPTVHDEPPMRFQVYDELFEQPACLLCNTPEEEAFIRRRFPRAVRSRVVGVGVEPPDDVDPARFREHFGLERPYLLYLGRLEAGKGVPALASLHRRLVTAFHDAPALVLAGSGRLEVSGPRVVKVGPLDEAMKWDALAGALAVVVPSAYESLSLVTLEAFAVGTPVLGNQASEVVAGQLARSLAGCPFRLDDPESFAAAVRLVGEARPVLSQRARAFAATARWPGVVDAYLEEIHRLTVKDPP